MTLATFAAGIRAGQFDSRHSFVIRGAEATADLRNVVREAAENAVAQAAQAAERERLAAEREQRMVSMTERLIRLTWALVWLGGLAVVAALLALLL